MCKNVSDLSFDRSEVEKPGKLGSTVRSRFGTEDKSERGAPVEEYQRPLACRKSVKMFQRLFIWKVYLVL